MPDCDLNQAVNGLMGAAYGSAGERCMAQSVAVAVGNIGDSLVENLKTKVEKLKVGPGMDKNSEMGPLVTKDHLDKVDGAMIGRSVYHSPYLLADIEKEIFNNHDIKEREEIVEELIDYVKVQVQMGTRVNQVMRHTLGLFHGQTGSSHWKRYLSENMCVRDADVKKIDHIMDKVRLSPKLHSAGRID